MIGSLTTCQAWPQAPTSTLVRLETLDSPGANGVETTMTFLSNAFSLNMLEQRALKLEITPISLSDAQTLCTEAQSYVGHEPTRVILQNILQMPVVFNRNNMTLSENDTLIVAQYRGPRLPEGATTLPEGAEIGFLKVRIV